jgi:hypothetical protein
MREEDERRGTRSAVSRRAFLQVVGTGASALGFSGLAAGSGADACAACRVVPARPHHHAERGHSGVYCPNCGAEWFGGRLRLDRELVGRPVGPVESRFRLLPQVPFPHHAFVSDTPKATAILSDIQW